MTPKNLKIILLNFSPGFPCKTAIFEVLTQNRVRFSDWQFCQDWHCGIVDPCAESQRGNCSSRIFERSVRRKLSGRLGREADLTVLKN